MTSPPDAGRVRLAHRVALHWRDWADEYVVFDGASGRTHLLDAWAACVLLNIEHKPMACTELARRAAASMQLGDDEAWRRLPVTLEQLMRIDLVEIEAQ